MDNMQSKNAAKAEGVPIIGTIGILDQLIAQGLISAEEYVACLKDLQAENGKDVRLPKTALAERISRFTHSIP